MQYFKLLCMSPLLPQLCMTICTTVRKFFYISSVVELLIQSKKCFITQQNKNYSSICKSIIITSPIGFNIALTNVDARLKQRCINVVPTLFRRCFTPGTDVVSKLCNVENPASDFVSFSTSDQRFFNVDPTLKCWLGLFMNLFHPPQCPHAVTPTKYCCDFNFLFWCFQYRHQQFSQQHTC